MDQAASQGSQVLQAIRSGGAWIMVPARTCRADEETAVNHPQVADTRIGALIGVLGVVGPVRFPCYSLGTRDVRLADVFRILKQGLDFFLYNARVFG
jgi:hypothetical protein